MSQLPNREKARDRAVQTEVEIIYSIGCGKVLGFCLFAISWMAEIIFTVLILAIFIYKFALGHTENWQKHNCVHLNAWQLTEPAFIFCLARAVTLVTGFAFVRIPQVQPSGTSDVELDDRQKKEEYKWDLRRSWVWWADGLGRIVTATISFQVSFFWEKQMYARTDCAAW